MISRSLRFGLLAGVAFATISTTASAEGWSSFVVFGDRWADSGQFPSFEAVTGNNPNDAGIGDGRQRASEFDPINGGTDQVYTQIISEQLGFGELLPSSPAPLASGANVESGTNYAGLFNSSADVLQSVIGDTYSPGGIIFRAPDGIETAAGPVSTPGFLAGGSNPWAENALVFITGGLEDVRRIANVEFEFDNNPGSIETGSAALAAIDRDETQFVLNTAEQIAIGENAANNIADGAVALAGAGAGLVVVPTLIDASQLPEARGDVSELETAINAFDQRILQGDASIDILNSMATVDLLERAESAFVSNLASAENAALAAQSTLDGLTGLTNADPAVFALSNADIAAIAASDPLDVRIAQAQAASALSAANAFVSDRQVALSTTSSALSSAESAVLQAQSELNSLVSPAERDDPDGDATASDFLFIRELSSGQFATVDVIDGAVRDLLQAEAAFEAASAAGIPDLTAAAQSEVNAAQAALDSLIGVVGADPAALSLDNAIRANLAGTRDDAAFLLENPELLLEARSTGTDAYNAQLVQRLQGADGNFLIVDHASLFDEVLRDPTSFGFSDNFVQAVQCEASDALEPCEVATGPADGELLFIDGLDPTAEFHALLGEFTSSLLTAPAAVAGIPYVAIGGARGIAATVSDQVVPEHLYRRGLAPFLAGVGAGTTLDDRFGQDSQDIRNYAGVAGLRYSTGDGLGYGAAIGYEFANTPNTSSAIEYDGGALFGTVFAGIDRGGIVGNISATYGDIDYDAGRVTTLGGSRRVNVGNAEGRVWGINGELGARLYSRGQFSAGPLVNFSHFDAQIDGYSEGGWDVTGITVTEDIDGESTRAGIGLFGEVGEIVDGYGAVIRGRALFAHEFQDDDSSVSVSSNAPNAVGSSFSAATRGADSAPFELGGEVVFGVGGKLLTTFGYDGSFGNSSIHTFRLGATYPLGGGIIK